MIDPTAALIVLWTWLARAVLAVFAVMVLYAVCGFVWDRWRR